MINLIEASNIYLITLIILAPLNYLLIKFFLTKFKIKKLLDLPNEKRKVHTEPVAKIGGIIIALNLYFLYFLFDNSSLNIILIICLTLIFLIGFIDDLFNLNPYLRLFLIILIVLIFLLIDENLIIKKIYFETFNMYINSNNIMLIFTIFCIVAIINAFNLFDGLNGLSLSYFLIIFTYIFFKFNLIELIPIISTCFVLIYFNLKNKIFLGDSGIYILAAYLGFKLIEINNHHEGTLTAENIFVLLMIPGIDMMRVFFERILDKKIFLSPDNRHLHHYLFTKYGLIKTLYFFIGILLFPILIYEAKIFPVYIIILLIIIIYSCFLINLKKNAQNK